ncbi:hypothetical protein COU36_02190 [Candidatus Micrarchaeota archaeon CG10_big_fil_rev_8_21_14_0_10_59_7]|nr:MAG: hypothetical protein COU36_02190 [Candidatus Micrarchaeota archaeon CG10_big_fil_rev_8_21_14_0_10_59_7]
MANKELIDYVKKCADDGFGEAAIRKACADAGWKDDEVSEAFKIIKGGEKKEECAAASAGGAAAASKPGILSQLKAKLPKWDWPVWGAAALVLITVLLLAYAFTSCKYYPASTGLIPLDGPKCWILG